MKGATSRREVLGRVVLAVTSAIVGVQGFRYLLDPEAVLASTAVSTASVDERSVLRAGYGGVLVAVGVVGLVASARVALRVVGHFVVLVVLVGLVAGRLVSLAVDGAPSALLTRLLVIEAVLVAANLATLVRRPQPR